MSSKDSMKKFCAFSGPAIVQHPGVNCPSLCTAGVLQPFFGIRGIQAAPFYLQLTLIRLEFAKMQAPLGFFKSAGLYIENVVYILYSIHICKGKGKFYVTDIQIYNFHRIT